MGIQLNRNKKLVILAAFLIFVAVGSVFITRSVNNQGSSASFAWDNAEARAFTTFGIDSSPLRTIYQYQIDPNSYYPLYANRIDGCEILGRYDTSSLSGGEEEGSVNLVASYSGQDVSTVQEQDIIFRGDDVVPVKTVAYEKDGEFYGVFGRWFADEGVQLIVAVTCDRAGSRDTAVIQALRSFSVVERSSSY